MQYTEETQGKQVTQIKRWKQGTGDANYKGLLSTVLEQITRNRNNGLLCIIESHKSNTGVYEMWEANAL